MVLMDRDDHQDLTVYGCIRKKRYICSKRDGIRNMLPVENKAYVFFCVFYFFARTYEPRPPPSPLESSGGLWNPDRLTATPLKLSHLGGGFGSRRELEEHTGGWERVGLLTPENRPDPGFG